MLEFDYIGFTIFFFLMVTFLQSGLDKIFDWKGNSEFIVGLLSSTPLKPLGFLLFLIITIMEILVGLICLAGMVQLLINGETTIGYFGCVLSAFTLIFLLIGQRMAKDYAGAFTLTGYFIISIIGMFVCL